MKFQIPSVAAVAAIGCVAGSVLSCSVADAQWKPDRLDASGPGVKLGDHLEFHPGVAFRGGYDTNIYKADNDKSATAGQESVGAGTLAVSPHFSITTQTAPRATEGESAGAAPTPTAVGLRLGAGLSYMYALSDRVPRNFDVDSDLWFGILPARAVNLALGGSYQRTTRPFGQAVANATNGTYALDVLRPSATLNLGTESRVLTGSVGYAPSWKIFEDETFKWLGTFGHQVDGTIGWKFLPQTSLVSALSYQTNSYLNTPPADASTLLSDGTAFKTKLGVNGAVTKRFVFRALAGYAVGFYDDALLEEFEDVIGEVSLGYKIATNHSLMFGYNRDIVPSPGGAWVRTDRLNLVASMKFANTFGLTLEGGYGFLAYGDMVALDTQTPAPRDTVGIGAGANPFERTDNRVDAAIRAQYDVTKWLALVADATVQATITDFEYNADVTRTRPLADPAGYTAFQFYGGTRLHY